MLPLVIAIVVLVLGFFIFLALAAPVHKRFTGSLRAAFEASNPTGLYEMNGHGLIGFSDEGRSLFVAVIDGANGVHPLIGKYAPTAIVKAEVDDQRKDALGFHCALLRVYLTDPRLPCAVFQFKASYVAHQWLGRITNFKAGAPLA